VGTGFPFKLLDELPDYLGQLDRVLRTASGVRRNGSAALDLAALAGGHFAAQLPIAPLQQFSDARLKNLLRYWMRSRGASLPSEGVLLQVLDVIRHYDPEHNALIDWGERGADGGAGVHSRRWQCRTFAGALWLLNEVNVPAAHWCQPVVPGKPVSLPAGLGMLELRKTAVAGMAGDFLNPAQLTEPLSIRFRQGGEQFRPAGRPGKRLKKWLQEWQIPPWERSRLPLLFCGDQLLWVPGQGLAEGFAADADAQEVLQVFWHHGAGETPV
jgi:tRNA(Ile)-lysidine synthase